MADIGSLVNTYIVYPARRSVETLTEAVELDSAGPYLRRKKRQTARVRLELTCAFPTQATANALTAFFVARSGASESFTWAAPPAALDPVGSGYTDCVFPEDRMAESVEGPSSYRMGFSVLVFG